PSDGPLEIGGEAVPVAGGALPCGERHAEGGGDPDGGSAAHDQGLDGLRDLLPARAGLVDLLGGQPRLVEQHEPLAVPADRRDHARARSSRARRSSTVSAPTRKSLSRPRAPLTITMADTGTSKASASSSVTARFARPSVGAAVTRTTSAPSRQPSTALRWARGWTRTARSAASGLDGRVRVIVLIGLELLIEKSLIHLDGRAEPLRELPAHALQRGHLRLDGGLRRPRGLDGLLAAQLRLAHEQRRLPPGALLHLLGDPLRRHERLLQGALAVLEAAGPLLQGLELLLEELVLFQQGLVVFGE